MTISIQKIDTVGSLPITNIKTISLASPADPIPGGATMTCKLSSMTDMKDRESSTQDLYLGAAIIQCKNSLMNEVLMSFGMDILKYINPDNNWNGTDRFDEILGDYLFDRGIATSVEDFKSQNMSVQTKNIIENYEPGIYNTEIQKNFSFPISSNNPPYLSYISFSYYDQENSSDVSTIVKNDVVFNNGVLSSTTYFYLLPDGEYWQGSVLKQGGSYFTGDGNMVPLRITKTANVKVQDFRKRFQIANLPVMSDFLNERKTLADIEASLAPKERSLNPSTTSHHPYISEAYVSSDLTKIARFMFMINFEDLIFNNSTYGKLWKTPYQDIKNEILNNSYLKSIKIFRRKVKQVVGSNSVGTSEKFILNKDEAPVLVASASRQGIGSPLQTLDSIKREVVAVPLETDSNIMTFNVSDNDIPLSSRAQYRYHVEIEAYDGSTTYLRDRIAELENFSRTLKNYLTEILHSTITTKGLQVRAFEGNTPVRQPEGYDPLHDRLTPSFASKMTEKYWDNILSGKESFLKVIQIFSTPTEISSTNLNNFMLLTLNPVSANPDSISSFMDALNGIVAKLRSSVGDPTGSSSSSRAGSAYSAKTDRSTISVIKHFTNTHDLANYENGGYDYLYSSTQQLLEGQQSTVGLKTIAGNTFRTRVNQETLKFFNNSTPSIKMLGRTYSYKENYMSYLSPSQVVVGSPYVPGNIVNILSEQSEKILKIIESKLLANKESQKRTGFSIPENGKFGTLLQQSELNDSTYSANYLQSYLAQNFGLTAETTLTTSKDGTNSPTNPLNEDDDNDETTSTLSENSLSMAAAAPASLYDSLIRSELVSAPKPDAPQTGEEFNKLIKKLPNQKIINLPNQIKAFLLTNASEDSGTAKLNNSFGINIVTDGRYSSTTTFNYRMLARIEYLEGFSTSSEGVMLMSSPRWKRLTEEDYGGFAGKKIFCRIAKYADETVNNMGLAAPESLNMKIYNQYFFLSPDSPSGTPNVAVGTRNISKSPNTATRGSRFTGLSEFGSTRLPRSIRSVANRNASRAAKELMKLSRDLRFDPQEPTVFSSLEETVDAFKNLVMQIETAALSSSIDGQKLRELEKYLPYFSGNSIEKLFGVIGKLQSQATDLEQGESSLEITEETFRYGD